MDKTIELNRRVNDYAARSFRDVADRDFSTAHLTAHKKAASPSGQATSSLARKSASNPCQPARGRAGTKWTGLITWQQPSRPCEQRPWGQRLP